MPIEKRIWRENEFDLFGKYKSIMYRCYNKKHPQFKNWGGRGIKCEWSTFEEFYRDMLPGYLPGLSIDRIDNDGNYCKENCQWLTRSENSRKADKNYLPESNSSIVKKRKPNPLDSLFDNSGLNIKGYCGEEKNFYDQVKVIDGIEFHIYGAI